MKNESDKLTTQIDLMKAISERNRKSEQTNKDNDYYDRLHHEYEQAEFQDREYAENFCSRNVINKMKAEGQSNTLRLRFFK